VNTNNLEFLSLDVADLLHTLVAKLLYLAKHGRPDIVLAVLFLCTRVKSRIKMITESWNDWLRIQGKAWL
jgi:hypothetical protein